MGLEEKYQGETEYWRSEYAHLREWFVDGTRDWWGIPPPREDQRINSANLWSTNAVLTMHSIKPAYLEELQLEKHAFAGQRILEVGCGPLIPSIQFVDCEIHALDPLLNAYMAAGWPVYEFGVNIASLHGEDMPYPSEYFDSAMAVNSLDHVDDFKKTAYEMQRVVKRGGGIFIEIEYHKPTNEEPHELNDELVMDAFSFSDMKKVSDRGKVDLFMAVARRFNLVNVEQFASLSNASRMTTWHGIRR